MSREEPQVISALVSLCKQTGITCLVQVGAEDGYEADEIRKATGCRAVCIEPDPKCAPASSKIEFHEALIGASNSVVDFYLHAACGLSSQIARLDGMEIKTEMPQYRLDKFCEKYGITPDTLVIDTEGTTLDVLEGCGVLLDNVRLIYAEVQTQMIRPGIRLLPEVNAFLMARGFARRDGPPAYSAGAQGNYLWVRP